MRLVFTIVALTGLLGLSIDRQEPAEVAALDLTNIQLTVADFPGAEPSAPVEVTLSPFEQTALWAVGLFAGKPHAEPLSLTDTVEVSHIDLADQVPDPIHYGIAPMRNPAK